MAGACIAWPHETEAVDDTPSSASEPGQAMMMHAFTGMHQRRRSRSNSRKPRHQEVSAGKRTRRRVRGHTSTPCPHMRSTRASGSPEALRTGYVHVIIAVHQGTSMRPNCTSSASSSPSCTTWKRSYLQQPGSRWAPIDLIRQAVVAWQCAALYGHAETPGMRRHSGTSRMLY
jgi:hypothetical protein